ncbi:MAG: Helix-turn-helix domain [Candidatus Parcubacteria bacterium]|jgi:excisionase family DNA binding protein
MNHDEIKKELPEATFTTNEVAKMLNIADATVLRWLKVEKIPGFFRIGHKWLIRKSDFEAFISKRVDGGSNNHEQLNRESKV